MSITTLSSRAFNQDTSGAKNATAAGPVIITDRGRPSHVLLTFNDYRKLTKAQHTVKIADLLALSGDVNDAFLKELELPKPRELARAADFK